MRALLALTLAIAAAAPASAGTWQPRSSFSTYGHVAVGSDGTTLISWPRWNYQAGRSEVIYRRVADDGSFGPEILAGTHDGSQCCDKGRGSAGPTVIDSQGTATLVYSFLDDSDYGGDTDCCYRYETALLPRGADAPIARERIEPSGRDRIGLSIAVRPSGKRVAAWFVKEPHDRDKRPHDADGRIQVLDAPASRGFGHPQTIASDSVQHSWGAGVELEVVSEHGGRAWVLWTTRRTTRRGVVTAVRAARREYGKDRWHVRTIARRTDTDGLGFRIDGSSLEAAAGHEGELLVAWDECDGDPGYEPVSCRIRARWHRPGAWGLTQTVNFDDVSTGRWGMVVDRKGRALVVFDACQRTEGGAVTDECMLQIAQGAAGSFFDSPADLGPGAFLHLAANRLGYVMLLYATGEYGMNGDYARWGRAGLLATGRFKPPERIDLGYMTSCCGSAVDKRGNFSFTAGGYDGGTFLLRYRR